MTLTGPQRQCRFRRVVGAHRPKLSGGAGDELIRNLNSVDRGGDVSSAVRTRVIGAPIFGRGQRVWSTSAYCRSN